MWVEYCEHKRRWDGQSLCWHSGEQYLAEWHFAQSLVLEDLQIVHADAMAQDFGCRENLKSLLLSLL